MISAYWVIICVKALIPWVGLAYVINTLGHGILRPLCFGSPLLLPFGFLGGALLLTIITDLYSSCNQSKLKTTPVLD